MTRKIALAVVSGCLLMSGVFAVPSLVKGFDNGPAAVKVLVK